MKPLFKQTKRFSEMDPPEASTTVTFFPSLTLTKDCSVPKAEDSSCRIPNGMRGTVVERRPHLIEVIFNGASKSDLVSLEHLTSDVLTEEGKKFFKDFSFHKHSAKTQEIFRSIYR